MARRPRAGDYFRDAIPTVSPTASPVDTFVRSAPKQSQGQALMTALEGLDDVVNPFLREAHQEAAEDETAEGQALFQKSRQGFRDAVRSGEIPAGASPYVRQGYRKAQLNAAAGSYATQLARELETSDFEKIEDPQEIERYLSEFNQHFIEQNNLSGWDPSELGEVFQPTVAKAHDQFRQAQMQKNIKYVERERFMAFEAEVIASIDMQGFGGGHASQQAALGDMTNWLQAKVAELDSEGLDRVAISESVMEIIASEAVRRKNPAILKLMDTVKLGTAALSGTKKGRALYEASESQIDRQLMADAAAARSAVAKAEEAEIEAAETAYYNAILDGNDLAKEQAAARLRELGDPETVIDLYREGQRFDDDLMDESTEENYEGFEYAMSNARDPHEARKIAKDYSNRISMTTRSTILNRTLKRIKDVNYNNFTSNNGYTAFKGRISNLAGQGSPWQPGRDTKAAIAAENDFDDMMADYYDRNPEASAFDVRDHARQVFNLLKEQYGPDDSGPALRGGDTPAPKPEPSKDDEPGIFDSEWWTGQGTKPVDDRAAQVPD